MKKSENYLDKIPKRNEKFNFTIGEDGIVTIEVENRGVFHFLAQKLLKKPKVTMVHLDRLGSFIWSILDGEGDVHTIGEKVDEKFGEEAKPLYERLIKYLQILESYGFIVWNS